MVIVIMNDVSSYFDERANLHFYGVCVNPK
jgi:hypothetical protein